MNGRTAALLGTARRGFTLPGPLYTDATVFSEEVETTLRRAWYLVAHEDELPQPGALLSFELAGRSVFLTRDTNGNVHAFANTCRHRGARICDETTAAPARALICRYHGWRYALDGRLVSARGVDPAATKSLGLIRYAVRVAGKLVFLSFDPADDGNFDAFEDVLHPYLDLHGFSRSRLAVSRKYTTRVNWKLLVENFAECYHCDNHPEYSSVMAHASGEARADAEAAEVFEKWIEEWRRTAARNDLLPPAVAPSAGLPWACGRIPMKRGMESQARSGRSVAKLMGSFAEPDGGISSIRLYPSSYIIANCDYAVLIRFLPISVSETTVHVQWLVDCDVSTVDEASLTWFWDVTTRQDNAMVEAQFLGVSSPDFVPGPLVAPEEFLQYFYDWYRSSVLDDHT